MKKTLALALAFLMCFSLAACSGSGENSSSQPASSVSSSGSESQASSLTVNPSQPAIGVDKQGDTVVLTIPPDLLDGIDVDSLPLGGDRNVEKRPDGSVTFSLAKADYEKLLGQLRSSLDELIEGIISSEDNTSIQSITYNETASEFVVMVEKKAYEKSADAYSLLALPIFSSVYQAFDGKTEPDITIKVTVKDAATGQVLDELTFPE